MTNEERKQVFDRVEVLVRTRYFDPHYNGRDWPELVQQHRPGILASIDDRVFEGEINSLLDKLGTSHTHFFSPRTKIPSGSSINATFRAVPTETGPRWAFQDVQPGGPADRAGIKPGDILLTIDGLTVVPPTIPHFQMGALAPLTVIHRNGAEREIKFTVDIARPKYVECPYTEPQSVVASILDNQIGFLKVTMFPGIIGVEFAREVDRAMEKFRECDRLIVDLRGNPGGGIGGLRLMSYLVPDKRPVGYSLTRKRAERGYRKEKLSTLNRIPDHKWKLPLLASRFVGRDLSIAVVTEGRGPQRFHGRIVALVNEHTSGAAEMVAGFIQENILGKVVGTRTAGRLLGGKGFKVGHGYILMIPVGAYLSWNGRRYEGSGIEPDIRVDWSPEQAESGADAQIDQAINVVSRI
ncbi:MAG: Carboxyl-terminal protease [Bryobacterales bacterium]|nr:Carboxyl-terminal protease [Bryobacterales bacterium]